MALTSKTKLLRNGLYNSGSWIANSLILMLATPYFVYKLSAEGYGVYVLLTGLVGYYGLLDLGLGQGVTKYVAQYFAAKDDKAIYRSINAALMVQLIVGTVGSIILALCVDPLLAGLKVPTDLLHDSKIGVFISAFGFLFTLLAGTLNSALAGLQLYGLVGKVSVLINIALTLAIAVALWLGFGLLATIVLTAMSALVLAVAYFVLLKSRLQKFTVALNFDFSEFKDLASYSGYMFLTKVSALFSQYIVRLVVSYFLGPAAVTIYVIPAKLTNAISGVLNTGFAALFPFTSELSQRGNKEMARKTFENGSRYFTAFAAPLFLFTMVAARPLLAMWMGDKFAADGWYVLALLSFNALLASVTVVPNLVTLGLGHSRLVGLVSIFTIVTYLILLPPLTLSYGLIGSCWAMLAANLPGLILIAYESEKIVQVGARRFVAHTFGVHFFPAAISFGLVFLQLRYEVGNMVLLFLGTSCFLGIYLVVMILRGYLPLAEWTRELRRS